MRFWLVFKILLHPIRYAQDRIDAWVMARVKRQSGPITIGRNRVYILPTRFGYFFAFMLLVMLLGAMNYSNSMAFLLTFLLSGIGLVCMHHTHANLAHLQLRAGTSEPVFAGETAHFEVRIDNPAAQPRYSLALSWPKEEERARPGDVEARASTVLMLSLPATRRGWLPARVFSLSTEYPLGLFHAWTWAQLDMRCLVFPHPARPGVPPWSSSRRRACCDGSTSSAAKAVTKPAAWPASICWVKTWPRRRRRRSMRIASTGWRSSTPRIR